MKSSRLFWGVILVVLGGLLLLKSLGIITFNVWLIFWPVILVMAGVWLLLGPALTKGKAETVNLDFPLESIQEAVIDVNHGAGTLKISGGAGSAQLMAGVFTGGVDSRMEKIGAGASLTLNPPSNVVWGFPGGIGAEGFRWDFRLTDAIPLDMRLHTGAGEARIDLSTLRVQKLTLETGASSTIITLPAKAGFTNVDVHAGAASVVLQVPQGVAGRITMKSGLVGTNIDNGRFPFNGTTYETPGYDSAANRVEIRVEAGVGSIEVKSA